MLVGLLGQAQSGKDSVADYLETNHLFVKASFAGELKRVCAELFDLTYDQLNTTEGKATIDPRYDITPRTILQKVGTDWFRSIYPKVWTDRLFKLIMGKLKVVITDVRFLNEVVAVKEHGGFVIRLIREDYQALQGKEAQHASEMEQLTVPEDLIDLTVSAKTGELEKLYKEVTDFLGSLELRTRALYSRNTGME